ncbi:MAG: RluA family pseudouridine synthase [Pelosinus sp.]|nr:RluA family pseudouridine synthase [Pelosinus sp.]
MLEFIVSKEQPPLTAKNFLRYHAGVSLTLWRKIKSQGQLLINGNLFPGNKLVYPGDILTITLGDSNCSITPVDLSIDICYEDDYLLVINKPAGMLVHPTTKEMNNTLANAVMHYYQVNNIRCGFHPVHRLDRNTSGLVLIAKTPYIQHMLSHDHIKKIRRIYYALVAGILPAPSGIIEAPIGRHPESIIERIVTPEGKNAITHYQVCKTIGQVSLVQLELETGRTHQIRVHLAYIGHPLLGDDLYGDTTKLLNRQALHAAKLLFNHPITHEFLEINSTFPNDMHNLIKMLKTK